MGFKTKNYEVKSMGVVLPEAYAIIRETATNGVKGYAKLAIHSTREMASNKNIKPYEEIRIDFTVNRNENDRITAYKAAKSSILSSILNEHTGVYEDAIIDMPFKNWEDDIVTNL